MEMKSLLGEKIRAFSIWCLTLLVVLSPLQALALSDDDLKVKMEEHIFSCFGYAADEYTVNSFGSNESECTFSVKLLNPLPAQDGLIVGVMESSSGELKEIRGSQDYTLDKLIQLSLSGSIKSIEGMYDFKCEWEVKLAAMTEAEIEGAGIWEKYLQVIKQDISLPDGNSIPFENAWDIAKAALEALPGWSEEKFQMFEPIIMIHYTPKEAQKPVYQFLFERYSYFSERYSGSGGEKALEEYEQKLFKAFGGDNLTTPWFISVMIDSHTGELYEDPIIECPPVSSHYLDFILR